ncbi:MAG: hypothetical protein Q9N67_08760 [Ghiorsea sp.]|nr:hypothetical protein [Ghiorsea sp.]
MYKEIPKPRTKEQVRKDNMEVNDSRGADFEEEVEMIYKYEQARYKELIKEEGMNQ